MKKQINDLLLKMQNGENCIGEEDEGVDWDSEMKKEIKVFDKMLKRNKIKRL